MSDRFHKLYRLLEISRVFSLSQRLILLGSERRLRQTLVRLFGPSGQLILDVGCGPQSLVELPTEGGGVVVGVDINPDYVASYAKGAITHDPKELYENPGKPRYGVVGSAEALPFDEPLFDETRSMGLLHHLPPESAQRAMREMVRCTKPGGRIVVLDSVWPKRSYLRPVAWLIRRVDRGRFVRTEQALVDLFKRAVGEPKRIERFTYSWHGLEGLWLEANKPV